MERKKREKEEKEICLKELSYELESIAQELSETEFNINKQIKNKQTNNLIMPPNLDILKKLNDTKDFSTYEKNKIFDFTNSKKYKLVTDFQKIHENIINIFNLEDNKFNGYQKTIENINLQIESQQIDIDNNINNIISIYVFLRESEQDFSDHDYSRRQIDFQSLKAMRIAYLEYDENFEILKKYSLAEIKAKACSLLGVKREDYMILKKNFEWIPFNLDVYKEIFTINLSKKCIDSSCRFFQFNSFISVN